MSTNQVMPTNLDNHSLRAKEVPNLDSLQVILATDCGSTTTKAILIEKIDGVFRQTYRGEAPTTVEEPTADVTLGVINAATEVGELAGRKLIDEHGQIIRPARGNEGCDIYISTSRPAAACRCWSPASFAR